MPTNPTDNYVWTITSASGGGVILSCVGSSNRVLKHNGSSLSLVTALSSSDAAYKQTVWGTISQTEYVNLTSFTIDNIDWISVGSQKTSAITATPSNSTYRSANWFDWESANTSVATVDENGRITGMSSGYALITATHKPTCISYSFYVTVGQTVANGNYYLKNVGSGRYLDVEGPSTAENAYIQVWSFHSGSQERWQVIYYGSGYYYIKSLYSNKYMSVSGGSSAAGAYIKQVSTPSEASRWKITKTVSDAYKITAQCGENNGRCLGISSTSANNGTDCSQVTYTYDSNFRDEWVIGRFTFTISNYYDQGYNVRFGDSYNDIMSYQNVCSNILNNIFYIDTVSTIHSYTSCSDTCTGTPTTLADTTTACIHSTSPHKTRWNLALDIMDKYGVGTSTTTKASWTGHVLESRSSGTYTDYQIIIMTIGAVTNALNVNYDDAKIRYERIYTLLHESSHALGAPDHYCYDETSSNCDNPTNDCWRCDRKLSAEPTCLMTQRMNDLETRLANNNLDTVYCSQCLSATHEKGIFTHLDAHHWKNQ